MLKNRIHDKELIDLPCCKQETIDKTHKFMRFVNRFLGGTSAVKDFIKYADSKNQTGIPLNILDIGSGSCDIPLSIIQWAKSQNIKIKFTCIEKESGAIELKQEIADLSKVPITFVNDDIFTYDPCQYFDYAVASMFFHHLNFEQIVDLTKRLAGYTRKGIFINDLHRTALTYTSCLLISPFISSQVRHDALISIKKGFKKNELKAFITASDSNLKVQTRLWGRITALLEFNGED